MTKPVKLPVETGGKTMVMVALIHKLLEFVAGRVIPHNAYRNRSPFSLIHQTKQFISDIGIKPAKSCDPSPWEAITLPSSQ